VIVVGDPWIYNEYLDGRKELKGFDNYTAANELVTFLLGN
jgi:unsaturated rhamnogalacturonyl hydrolase